MPRAALPYPGARRPSAAMPCKPRSSRRGCMDGHMSGGQGGLLHGSAQHAQTSNLRYECLKELADIVYVRVIRREDVFAVGSPNTARLYVEHG